MIKITVENQVNITKPGEKVNDEFYKEHNLANPEKCTGCWREFKCGPDLDNSYKDNCGSCKYGNTNYKYKSK